MNILSYISYFWFGEPDCELLYKNNDVKALLRALKYSNRKDFMKQRELAAKYLGDLGDKKAVKGLLNAIKCDNIRLKICCIQSLGKIKDKKSLRSLIEITQNDNDKTILTVAFESILKIKKFQASDKIRKMLRDKNFKNRIYIIRAIGEQRESSYDDLLIKFLDYHDRYICAEAAIALGKINKERYIIHLLNAILHGNYFIAKHVIESIGKIGGDTAANGLISLIQNDSKIIDNSIDNRKLFDKIIVSLIDTRSQKAYNYFCEINIDKILMGKDVKESIKLIDKINSTYSKIPVNWVETLLRYNSIDIRNYVIKHIEKTGWKPDSKSKKMSFELAKGNLKGLLSIGGMEELINVYNKNLCGYRKEAARELYLLNWLPDTNKEKVSFLFLVNCESNLNMKDKDTLKNIIFLYRNNTFGLGEKAAKMLYEANWIPDTLQEKILFALVTKDFKFKKRVMFNNNQIKRCPGKLKYLSGIGSRSRKYYICSKCQTKYFLAIVGYSTIEGEVCGLPKLFYNHKWIDFYLFFSYFKYDNPRHLVRPRFSIGIDCFNCRIKTGKTRSYGIEFKSIEELAKFNSLSCMNCGKKEPFDIHLLWNKIKWYSDNENYSFLRKKVH